MGNVPRRLEGRLEGRRLYLSIRPAHRSGRSCTNQARPWQILTVTIRLPYATAATRYEGPLPCRTACARCRDTAMRSETGSRYADRFAHEGPGGLSRSLQEIGHVDDHLSLVQHRQKAGALSQPRHAPGWSRPDGVRLLPRDDRCNAATEQPHCPTGASQCAGLSRTDLAMSQSGTSGNQPPLDHTRSGWGLACMSDGPAFPGTVSCLLDEGSPHP